MLQLLEDYPTNVLSSHTLFPHGDTDIIAIYNAAFAAARLSELTTLTTVMDNGRLVRMN